MGQLKDIVRVRRAVTTSVGVLQVNGLPAAAIGDLVVRYPDLRKMFSGIAVEPEALISVASGAVAPIIAAGLGSHGDLEEEAAVQALPLADQLILVREIMSITFPEGIGPFVEQLASLAGLAAGEASATEPGSS